MLLLILACATMRTATIVTMTPGAAPGEIYVLAEVFEGHALGTEFEVVVAGDRVLLRCQEEAFSTGYSTTCHPFITAKEAERAALSGGDVIAFHSMKPIRREPKPPPVRAHDDEDK